MAERRMFAKSIVLSDAFLDMPLSARCLYFTLGMLADDDGFVGNPKSIMRQCGASQDDMAVLLSKRYVLGFESGVIVIKHWRMNNYLQNDRHKPTTYLEELSTLEIDKKGAYTERKGGCIQNVYEVYTQDSIGKVSIDKDSKGKVSIDNTPLPPKGEDEYDFDKHSNGINYQYIKTTVDDEFMNYIINHVELDECVMSWMKYKDEKKPKSSNHYGETGLITLLKKIYKESQERGVSTVITLIEDSMSNNYQGITWNKTKSGSKSQTESVFDAWARA